MHELYIADNSIEHRDFNEDIKDAEEFPGSVLTAHYFRHNYASLLYNAGVDVLTAQRYLGHSDPSTTLRIYTHLSKQTATKDKKKVMKILGKLPGSCRSEKS